MALLKLICGPKLAIEADLKRGEKIVLEKSIFALDDAIFKPSNRPSLDSAISMIVGSQSGFEIPFAAVPLSHHADMAEQNLFRCLFGRDSLLISDLLKNQRPEMRLSVVLALASVQGASFDALSEEEPGRIAHEVRDAHDLRGLEIAARANWKFPYYGSVDATLIWLRVLAEISVADPAILDIEVGGLPLWRRAVLATQWVLRRLDTPSGLIESHRANPNGISNQVWKDSGDSYMHSDGTLAKGGSTASIETVAEVFDALLAARSIQELHPDSSWPIGRKELQERALKSQSRLFDLMWLGDRFALGTERDETGRQRPFDSQASNQGRLLDSQVLEGNEFESFRIVIAQALCDTDLLGATGLRTLSKAHVSYRPGGYHTGSAWPMDGIFAARGLARHGLLRESKLLAERTKFAIESFGGYPEFFRGDWPSNGLISTSVVEVFSEGGGLGGARNRVSQPPQIIQGWTVGAYAWISEFYS
jgi:glycogen debranching enzyme